MSQLKRSVKIFALTNFQYNPVYGREFRICSSSRISQLTLTENSRLVVEVAKNIQISNTLNTISLYDRKPNVSCIDSSTSSECQA